MKNTFKTNPEERANIFSKLCLNYLNPLLRIGKERNRLDLSDMFPIQKRDESYNNYKLFQTNWDKLVKEKKTKRILLWTLQNTYGFRFHAYFIFKLIADLCEFIFPFIISEMITFLQDPNIPFKNGVFYTLILTISYFLSSFCSSYWEYSVAIISFQARSALINSIYKKSLSISNSVRERDGQSKGNTVNLVSDDVDIIKDFLSYGQQILSVPIQLIVSIFLLYRLIDWSCFVGFSTFLIFFPLNFYVSMKSSAVSEEMYKVKDIRISKMSEYISGIRVLKFYGWINLMMNKVKEIRQQEIKLLKKRQVINSLLFLFWDIIPDIVVITSFSTFLLIGQKLNVNTLMTSLSLFFIVKVPLSLLPHMLTAASSTMVSINRVEKFLINEEISSGLKHSNDIVVHFGTVENKSNLIDNNLSISFKNASFQWNTPKESMDDEIMDDEINELELKDVNPLLKDFKNDNQDSQDQQLKDINLDISRGSLNIIFGPVGSGKSSLLSAILGDMKLVSGGLSRFGKRISFVSQIPWILNGTFRENILFGSEYNEARYNHILDVCCLVPDLNVLPAYDLCEIGEKGINLSGGQKQRVAIARALYSDSDLYIFDDPLSALDLPVATQIFNKAIKPLSPNKTCILVTHQKFLLESANTIISMRDGMIDKVGGYNDFPKEEWDIFNLNEFEKKDDVNEQQNNNQDEEFDDSEDGTLVQEEMKNVGKVSVDDYMTYLKKIGGFYIFLVVMTTCVAPGLSVFSNYWVTLWADNLDKPNSYFISIYILIVALLGVFSFVSKLLGLLAGINASTTFHNDALKKVFRSPIQFFDKTLSGRILNIFSRDISNLDSLADSFSGALECLIFLISYIIIVAIASPVVLITIIPLAGGLWSLKNWYLPNERELQRLSSIALSPLISHFSESLSGQQTIRAFGASDRFFQENVKRLNLDTTVSLLESQVITWANLRLSLISSLVIIVLSISAILLRNTVSPTLIGLALSYCIVLVGDVNWFFHQWTFVEVEMNCVERLQRYCHLEEEAPDKTNIKLDTTWPSKGGIVFTNFSMRYREELSPSLNSINISIPPTSKVGICGRTGSGKSSLLLSLFRLVESCQGSIEIDGVDISKVGLEDLRSKLTIIPQDPILFNGTIRYNLDPTNQYTDMDIWEILNDLKLSTFISNLEIMVNEDGNNFSVGQRQLICLCRALLRNSKIVALDESTASVDMETDEMIQNIIRTNFKNSTVITIAHRLSTIMDYDFIIVMADGQVQNIGKPSDIFLKNQKDNIKLL